VRLVITRAILNKKVRDAMGELSRNGAPAFLERLQSLQRQGKVTPEVNLNHVSALIGAITFSLNMFTDVVSTWAPETADEVTDLAARLLGEALTPRRQGPT
jgi:hypothetical protein